MGLAKSAFSYFMKVRAAYLLLASVAVSLFLTSIIVALMSVLFHGRVTADFMITGIVTAGIVSAAVLSIFIVVLDRLRESDRALIESRARYQAIVDGQDEFVIRYLPGGAMTFINDSLCNYCGIKREQLLGSCGFMFMREDYRAEFVRQLEALDAAHPSMVAEGPVVMPDGRETWHRWTHHAIFGESGRIVEYQGSGRDVTEQHEAQRELAESRARYKAIVDSQHEFVVRYLPGGVITFANDTICNYSGLSREQLVGNTFFRFVGEDYLPELIKRIESLTPEHPETVTEGPVVMPDGRRLWHHWMQRAIFDDDGNIVEYQCTGRDVTEQHEAERRLALMSFALNNVHEAAFLVDEDSRVVYVNEEASRVLGYSREELLGMTVADLDAEPLPVSWEEHWAELKARGSMTFEGRHKAKDGRVFPVEINANYIEYDGRGFNMGLVRDITERKKSEEVIRRSEARLAEAQRIAHIGSWEMDIATGALLWSDEVYRICEIENAGQRIFTADFLAAVHPEDREMVKRDYYESIRNRVPHNVVNRLQMPDGRIKYIHSIAEATYDAAGGPIRSIGIMHDITTQREAEIARKQSEDMLQTIIDAEPECVKLLDRDANLIFMSRSGLGMIEADSLDEIKGRCMLPIVAPEDREDFMALTRRVFRGESGTLEFSVDGLKTGRRLRVDSHAVPFRDETGKIVALLGVTRDVTAQRMAEAAVRGSEARLAEAQRIARLGSWEIDITTGNAYWSDEIYDVLGVDKETHPASIEAFLHLVHPDDLERVESAFNKSVSEGVPIELSHRIVLPSGNIRHVLQRCETVFDASGRPLRTIGTAQDITGQREAEEKIERSLKEKEVLLSEIHHRVKNNMAVISSLLKMQSAYAKDPDDRMMLLECQSRIKSMALVHEKLYQSRDFSDINLQDYVQSLLNSIRGMFETRGRIRAKVEAEALTLDIETMVPCGLIINELVSNSFKHAFKNGVEGPSEIAVEFREAPDDMITLTVSDNGVGLPPGLGLSSPSAKGLGLKLVEALSTQLRAEVSVSRERGTEFRFTFPRSLRTARL